MVRGVVGMSGGVGKGDCEVEGGVVGWGGIEGRVEFVVGEDVVVCG